MSIAMRAGTAFAGAILMAALSGCSREQAPAAAVPAAAAAPAAERSSREVVLDDAAQKQAGIQIVTVETRSIPQRLRVSGRLALNENRTWKVGAVTEGRVVRTLVNPGDEVLEGQVLARMHSHTIHEARADYRKAVGELSRLKSVEAFALRSRDRARRLFQLKAASQEQTEHAETELRNAQTAVANAQIEMDRTRLHLVEFLQVPADLAEHAPGVPHDDNEDLIPVKSPASGTVMTRSVTPGTVVAASGEMFTVSDLSTLWLIASVNEQDLARVRPGMPARVFVQAYPDQPFVGTITRLAEELDPATRTVRARVELPNRSGRLKPEMYATAELEIGGSEPALFVPQEALQEVTGQTVVFVRKAGGHFEVRTVEPGPIVAGLRQIASGLKAGETVVSHGSFLLKSQLLKSSLEEE